MNKFLIFALFILIVSCSGEKKENSSAKETIPQKEDIQSKAMEQYSSSLPTKSQKNDTIPTAEMVYFEGGTFMMGSVNGMPNEQPVHKVTLAPFSIDRDLVSVEQFGKFVEETNFKTEAEKFGDSGVFNLDGMNWELLPGAFWKKPFGPNGPEAEHDHPVTHVSWNDAVAYATWAGKRLPTEAEWEYAAKSGKDSEDRFSWGNRVSADGKYFANTWQGTLQAPEVSDGFLYTSPVGVFGTNEAGLSDMGGNVWQWCADTYKAYPGGSIEIPVDPNVKVIRGGSFFFDQAGELSYTVSFRGMNSVETSLFNTGFRCAKDGE